MPNKQGAERSTPSKMAIGCFDSAALRMLSPHDERIVGGALEWRVDGNRGDSDEFGGPGRDHDGNGVIVAWIAVEEDRGASPGGGSLRHDASMASERPQ